MEVICLVTTDVRKLTQKISTTVFLQEESMLYFTIATGVKRGNPFPRQAISRELKTTNPRINLVSYLVAKVRSKATHSYVKLRYDKDNKFITKI